MRAEPIADALIAECDRAQAAAQGLADMAPDFADLAAHFRRQSEELLASAAQRVLSKKGA